jgi:hypothetical protein
VLKPLPLRFQIVQEYFPIELQKVKEAANEKDDCHQDMKTAPFFFTQTKKSPVGPVCDTAGRGYKEHDPGDYQGKKC